MRTLYNIVLAVLCGALVVSCVQDPEFEPTPTNKPVNKIIGNADGALSGELIIYVDDATADAWHSIAEPTRSGIVALDAVAAEMGVESLRPVFNMAINADKKRERGMHRWFVVEFEEDTPVESVAQRYAAMTEVERVEYAMKFVRPEVNVVPMESHPATRSDSESFNDPMLPLQWGLHNEGSSTIFSTAYAGADINAYEAWKYATGNPKVVVAVVDEGVKYTHPDLAANMWTNTAELNGAEGVDDDGNGYVDDIYGLNTIEQNGNISWNNRRYDSEGNYIGDVGHGTHVAGIIAAVNNNGEGISSIAGGSGNGDGVRIMSVQIFQENTGVANERIAAGIEYAADMGAAILQCSWGQSVMWISDEGYEANTGSIYIAAIKYFVECSDNEVMDGGVAIFAAGNESLMYACYPGAYNEFISVTAIAADGLPTGYTNYHHGCNIAAPGGDYEYVDGLLNPNGAILSTVPSETPDVYNNGKTTYGADYAYMSGTSMACPYVSGVAALALSSAVDHGIRLTNDDLYDIICSSVNDINHRLYGSKTVYTYSGKVSEIVLDDYRGKMGIGMVDALYAVSRVYGHHTIAAQLNKTTYININDTISDGKLGVEILDYEISEDVKKRLGIDKQGLFGKSELYFVCTKPGLGTITIRYYAGCPPEKYGPDMSGKIIEREYLIIAREDNDRGGWL
ncbi:MAG: S8 family serine peptidase [Alistipes sp.]|nr:S8 family serine peptidase [Alistipes sp.]